MNYQIILFLLQALFLGNAIFWSLIWIGKVIVFCILVGIKGEASKIRMRFIYRFSISWAIFYLTYKISLLF
jgi:hypothetical protein